MPSCNRTDAATVSPQTGSDVPNTDIVTFLWRDASVAGGGVLLLASKITDPLAPTETALQPILGTDIRALSIELPDTWVGG